MKKVLSAVLALVMVLSALPMSVFSARASATELTTTITFDANGGTGGTSVILQADTTLTPPTVTRVGYTFAGWSPSVPAAVPEADTTYIAQWTIKHYSVRFESNSSAGATVIVQDYNTSVIQPASPTMKGHTFAGWYLNSSLTIAVIWPYTLVESVTFYAKYTANNYTVNFDAQGGSVSPLNINVTYFNAYGSLPTPTKAGCTFSGWYTGPNGSGKHVRSFDSVITAQDHTLYAYWIPLTTCIVDFDATGGSVSPNTKSVTTGLAYGTLPTPTKTGFAFKGWWTEPQYSSIVSGTPVYSSSIVTETSAHTLYAKWVLERHRLAFDLNGGTGGVILDYDVPAGTKVTFYVNLPSYSVGLESPDPYDPIIVPMIMLEPPERSGYTFLGWATSPTATTPTATYTMPASDVTLYAVWSKGNGGTGSILYGDLNGDGNIDNIDAGIIVDVENYRIVWDPVDDANLFKAADVNGDGNVDCLDAGLIVDVESFLMYIDQNTGLAGPY